MKKFTTFILTSALAVSISGAAFAAEIPRESAPENATEESIIITENLIGGILDEVQNGLGYQPAWCQAHNVVFNAVLADNTNGYGYADLAAISRNAILLYRDMYIRPEYYAEKENEVRALISDLITDVENGADYETTKEKAYTRIYQSANSAYNPEFDKVGDFCYWELPATDNVIFSYARKLLLEAEKRRDAQ